MNPESSSPPPPLPRFYDDDAVLQLETLGDTFLARELEQRRFSEKQEGEWVARVAKDVRDNERTTDVVKRWLKAVSLSTKREFCNFVPPLTDEAFQLFVQFFWNIKTGNRLKANRLLRDTRQHQWGLESYFFAPTFNKFLESGDDLAVSAAESSRARYPTGQAVYLTGKPRKTLHAVGRKRNNRSFSSAITKRRLTAQPRFKKRRLSPKARLAPEATSSVTSQDEGTIVHQDVARLEEVASDSVEKRRGRKRKLKHDDAEYSEPQETLKSVFKLRPRRDKRVKARAKTRKRVEVEHGGVHDSPEPLHHSVAKPDELHVASGVSEPGMLSRSNSNATFSVGADEHAPKWARRTTTKPTRKRRSSGPNTLSRPTVASQTLGKMAKGRIITEPDQVVDHTAAGVPESRVDKRRSLPPFTFDNAGEEVPEDEVDPCDCTLSDYPVLGLEEEKHVSQLPKPPLSVTPPIWAQSRQEVCETLDYFRSYQGGVYHSNDIVKGYLLGAHSSSRDLFHHGGRLIISHGGGKSEALHSKNRRLEIRGPGDQLEDDRSVRALLNNFRSKRPLVVFADDNYALFPFNLTAKGYTYVVLGLYWIAHAWAELQRVDENHSVVRYKFAFQWCEGQGYPWWLSNTENGPIVTQAQNSQVCDDELGVTTMFSEERENSTSSGGSEALQPQITEHFCSRCRLSSPLVYQDTPICLQPSCTLFFREVQAKSDSSSCAQTLSYSTELLRLQPANHQPVSAESIIPPLPNTDTKTSRPFAKGMHCRVCGRLSTRFKWENYECSNCHRLYDAPRFLFTHKDFWLQENGLKFHQYRVTPDSGIVTRKLAFRPQTNGSALPYVQTFDLPDNRGSVHLIPGHPTINADANLLFQEYQRQAAGGEIQFRRWPLRAHKCRGQLLPNYFSQNTGSPYQYIGGSDRTTPMEDGAKAVRGALELIKQRIATALGKEVPFNEVLSAAYMEKQKMAFHSDSERGLGPVIASLSLGSTAEMHFRLQSKYTVAEGHRKIAMTIILRHGDVLVMDGAGVQEYYEHAVVPKNFRIVATARLISPENYMS